MDVELVTRAQSGDHDVLGGATGTIRGNALEASRIAISTGGSPTVSGNDVCGGKDSIWTGINASPELRVNQLC